MIEPANKEQTNLPRIVMATGNMLATASAAQTSQWHAPMPTPFCVRSLGSIFLWTTSVVSLQILRFGSLRQGVSLTSAKVTGCIWEAQVVSPPNGPPNAFGGTDTTARLPGTTLGSATAVCADQEAFQKGPDLGHDDPFNGHSCLYYA